MQNKKYGLLAICMIAGTIGLSAQVTEKITTDVTSIYYEENKNQWPSQVLYKADLKSGVVFIEATKFTFAVQQQSDLHHVHELQHEAETNQQKQKVYDELIRCHAWSVSFEGAAQQPTFSGENVQRAYSNYFIGNDSGKWASNVKRFGSVFSPELYNGIGLRTYSANGWFKYDFIVDAGADITQIKLRYDGVTPLLQDDGTLRLDLSTGAMQEQQPVAWQINNGLKIPVRCNYKLDGTLLSFDFPDGYNKALPLIIDPTLIGSTYSGSTVTVFGNCAAPDNQGNLISGGQAFGIGYPVTMGAFSVTFGGGIDIAISKYNNNASALIYATFIGGNNIEVPFSLLTSPGGDLFILGVTNSSNYPVSAGAYDISFNGQDDYIISQLNSTGSIMMASTFVGGSNIDGWLFSEIGDLSLTQAGDLLVAGTTLSSNFPVTAGAFQQTLSGTQDAVLFSLSPGLSTLNFSTFLGGSGDEIGSDVALNPVSGDIIICGSTWSSNFPLQQAFQPAFSGVRDGFITRFNSTGTALTASTYYGTAGNDICMFVETDAGGNVYVCGNSSGTTGIPITAGVYSNPNSATFISKFDPLLQTVIYSTQIGTGNITDIPMLTAFMINECENIFVSGFFGSAPVTANALYNSTNSPGNSYIAVLAKDAVSLSHATYFGGDHIESGKCRFDQAGTIYHATCQTSATAFPVSPGAYCNSNNTAGGYDVCAFKISFPPTGVIALASVLPSNNGCAPFVASFVNTSNGINYYWDFGDGSPIDTNTSPSHTYTVPGIYTVTLIAEDSSSCIIRDTITLSITVVSAPIVILPNDTLFCGNISPQLLDAGNPGLTYNWSTGATTQTITITAPGLYWVTADNGSCSHTDSILISQIPVPAPLPDTSFCIGEQQTLNAGSGQSWLWNTGAVTQSIVITAAGNYSVIISNNSCTFHDTASVIFNPVPVVNIGNDTFFCTPQLLTLDAGNTGTTWLWSTGATTQQITVNGQGSYYVTVTALNCSATDTLNITVAPQPELGPPQSICGIPQLTISPGNFPSGTTFLWNNGATTPSITVNEAGTYYVTVTYNNCQLSDTLQITGVAGEGTLFTPNSFTPNGDGVNDVFFASGAEISEFHLTIFNRWGELVFESYSMTDGWDGSYKNETVQQDTYVAIITYRTPCINNLFKRKVSHINVLK